MQTILLLINIPALIGLFEIHFKVINNNIIQDRRNNELDRPN